MATDRVEVAVREVKRQCKTLLITAEQNTSVRIADDSPQVTWLPRSAAKAINKMRFVENGKTSELSRTGRRWHKLERKFGSGKLDNMVSVNLRAAWLKELCWS